MTKLDSLMEGVTDLVAVGEEVVEASLGVGGRCTKNGALRLMSDWRVEDQSWFCVGLFASCLFELSCNLTTGLGDHPLG